MFLYLSIFICISILSFLPNKKYLLKAIMIFLFLMCAFRSEFVDRDYTNYITLIFASANNLFYPIELSFKLISFIAVNILDGYYFVFIIFALISISLKYSIIKKSSPFLLLSVLVYYSNTFLLQDMTQIRAGVAGAIVLYSVLQYAKNKNIMSFVMLIVLASTFHITALLFFIVLAFDTNVVSRRYIFIYFLTLIGAYCCYYLGVNFITLLRYIPVSYVQYKFSDYISQAQGADFVPVNIFSVMQILHLLIVILSFVFSRKNILSHDKVLFIKIYSLSPLAFIILSSMPVFALRVSELFAISEIILIPSLPLLFRQKQFAKLAVIGICFIMFYINIYHVEILNEYSTL